MFMNTCTNCRGSGVRRAGARPAISRICKNVSRTYSAYTRAGTSAGSWQICSTCMYLSCGPGRMHIYMYIYAHVRMYEQPAHTYVPINTHIYNHTYTYMRTCARTDACTHLSSTGTYTYICLHTHRYTYICLCTCINTHIHTRMRLFVLSPIRCKRTHTYIRIAGGATQAHQFSLHTCQYVRAYTYACSLNR
jgi:hypothetical protein